VISLRVLLSGTLSLLFLLGAAAYTQEMPASAKTEVWFPGKAWALELDDAGFATRANEIQPDGRRYFLAENTKTRAVVSVYLEAAKGPVQPGECKRALVEKEKHNSSLASGSLKGVTYRESGEIQILEFTLPELDGSPTNQKNIFGCLIKDDVVIDIHISKVFFKAADQPMFDALLQSFHFVPREASAAPVPSGNSLILFQEGSRYFIAHQYRESIRPYQKALEIEKSTPTLDKNLWRVLIDNLSIAYGITHDLTSAREALTYGVSKDPDYPLFYYNLASIAAEKGDLLDTENYLKLAFERRENLIPGETFPDARVDDSFQKLLLQKEFRQFLNSLYGPQQ
jgi:tetratricopeptide (TPR) repeat protein